MYRPKRRATVCPYCGTDKMIDVGGYGPNTYETERMNEDGEYEIHREVRPECDMCGERFAAPIDDVRNTEKL